MNKLLWIAYKGNIVEVVTSSRTLPKLKALGIETIEIETVKSRPLSFRVIADKYLCNWLGLSYQELRF